MGKQQQQNKSNNKNKYISAITGPIWNKLQVKTTKNRNNNNYKNRNNKSTTTKTKTTPTNLRY